MNEEGDKKNCEFENKKRSRSSRNKNKNKNENKKSHFQEAFSNFFV